MNPRILALVGLLLAAASIIAAFLVYQSAPVQQPCDSFDYFNCPSQCVVCPPCEVCSMVACRSEEFCANLGFNRTWYEEIKARLAELS